MVSSLLFFSFFPPLFSSACVHVGGGKQDIQVHTDGSICW